MAVGVSLAETVAVAVLVADAVGIDVSVAVTVGVAVAVFVMRGVTVLVGCITVAVLIGTTICGVLVGAGTGVLVASFGSFVGARRVGEGTVCANIVLAQVTGPTKLAATMKTNPAITTAAIKRCVFMLLRFSSPTSYHIGIVFG